MSAAQTMESVSTRVSTLLVLTSVSVEVDIHYLAIRRLVMVFTIYISMKLYVCPINTDSYVSIFRYK